MKVKTGPDTTGHDRGCQAGQGRAGYDLVGTARPHMQLFTRMTKRDKAGTAQRSGHECCCYT